jgi:hypothetical protein
MRMDSTAGLTGMEIRSADGELLGRVGAVHVPEGGADVLLVQMRTATPDFELVVPVVDASVDHGVLVLPYSAEEIRHGPAVPGDAALSLGETAYVFDYYRAGEVQVAGRSLTERASGASDVDAADPDVQLLPPIVIVRPRHADD